MKMNYENNMIGNLFEQVSREFENKEALISDENVITYKQLLRLVNNLTCEILTNIDSQEKVIGIYMNRSIEMVVSILAVLYSGRAYVPIDPNIPVERCRYIIEKSYVHTLLVSDDFDFELFGSQKCMVVKLNYNIENRINSPVPPVTELGYIIYTSGSTGEPKGVLIKQSSIINLLEGLNSNINYISCDSILAVASMSFDMSIPELLLPFLIGMTVYLANDNQVKNPLVLLNIISDNHITLLQATPSRMMQFLQLDSNLLKLKSLRKLVIGADVFPDSLLRKINERISKSMHVYNIYGPTEATVWATVADLTGANKVHAGKPLNNVSVHIYSNGEVIDNCNEKGEICISGLGISNGYVNDANLTENKFKYIKDGILAYFTGDVGYLDCDGNLIVIGRLDNQVKIRGYRVELEEIENIAMEMHGMSQVAICCYGDEENKMCLFWSSDYINSEAEIRNYLKNKIPQYMLPSVCRKVDTIPKNCNGKVDRNKLFSEFLESSIDYKVDQYEEIKKIISQFVSNKSEYDINRSLFEYGLDSITYLKVIVQIEEQYGISIDIQDYVYEHTKTIREFIEDIYKKIIKDN